MSASSFLSSAMIDATPRFRVTRKNSGVSGVGGPLLVFEMRVRLDGRCASFEVELDPLRELSGLLPLVGETFADAERLSDMPPSGMINCLLLLSLLVFDGGQFRKRNHASATGTDRERRMNGGIEKHDYTRCSPPVDCVDNRSDGSRQLAIMRVVISIIHSQLRG